MNYGLRAISLQDTLHVLQFKPFLAPQKLTSNSTTGRELVVIFKHHVTVEGFGKSKAHKVDENHTIGLHVQTFTHT